MNDQTPLFRSAWDQASDAMVLSDPQGIVLAANPAYVDLYGYREDEVIGRDFAVIFAEEFREWARDQYRNVFALETPPPEFESRIVRKDGSQRVVATRIGFVSDGGVRQAMLSIIRDVTDRKRDEEAVARLAAIVDSTDVAVVARTPDGVISSWNRAAERLFGYSAEEVIGRHVNLLIPADQLGAWERESARLNRGEAVDNMETVRLTKSGDLIPVTINATPVLDLDGTVIGAAALYRDLTEQYRKDTALRAAHLRLHRFIDSNIIGIIVADEDRIIEANDIFLNMIGYDRGDLEAGTLRWRELTPHDYAPMDDRAIEELRTQGTCTPFEKAYIHKNGSEVPILLGAATIDGTPDRWFCFVVDLTRQKAAEAEREQLLARAEAALRIRDEFLGAAAHDLKNPLASLALAIQMIQRRLQRGAMPTPEELLDDLANMNALRLRMQIMIDELADLARLESGQELPLQYCPVDLVQLSNSVARDHQHGTTRHKITVESSVESLEGYWDQPRLERAVANLVSNAVKYSPEGGDVLITVDMEPDNLARISVTDRGVGIPAADLPTIFDRYSRARNVRGITGTGIGLASAKRLVELHGGDIDIESQEGMGTTVTVRLPVAG